MAILILASASPRRRELLQAAGIPHLVRPVEVDESHQTGEPAAAYVARVAALKAELAASRWPDAVVLAADTAVAVDATVLGKPRDAAEASRMLRLLSGRAHDVVTGVDVRGPAGARAFVERTRVVLADLSAADLAWYVATGEPMDKAGAYAIQGLASRFVTAIEGSYANVVGLPVAGVVRALREIGARGA